MNQIYVYIYPHIPSLLRLPPTLPIPVLYVDTKHWADLPVLCGCFPLAIFFTFGSVYVPCHSLTSSELTLPPPWVLKSILYVSVFTPVLTLGSSEPLFLKFHTYVLAYGICFSLSELLHSVWQTLGPSTSLQNSILFLFMAE